MTEQTIESRERLFDELADVRRTDVAYDYEGELSGLWSVASAVTRGDNLYGAINVSGPAIRISTERFEEGLPTLLKGTANGISINMTFS